MRIIFSILFFAFLGFSEINSATEPTEERVADLIKIKDVEVLKLKHDAKS